MGKRFILLLFGLLLIGCKPDIEPPEKGVTDFQVLETYRLEEDAFETTVSYKVDPETFDIWKNNDCILYLTLSEMGGQSDIQSITPKVPAKDMDYKGYALSLTGRFPFDDYFYKNVGKDNTIKNNLQLDLVVANQYAREVERYTIKDFTPKGFEEYFQFEVVNYEEQYNSELNEYIGRVEFKVNEDLSKSSLRDKISVCSLVKGQPQEPLALSEMSSKDGHYMYEFTTTTFEKDDDSLFVLAGKVPIELSFKKGEMPLETIAVKETRIPYPDHYVEEQMKSILKNYPLGSEYITTGDLNLFSMIPNPDKKSNIENYFVQWMGTEPFGVKEKSVEIDSSGLRNKEFSLQVNLGVDASNRIVEIKFAYLDGEEVVEKIYKD